VEYLVLVEVREQDSELELVELLERVLVLVEESGQALV